MNQINPKVAGRIKFTIKNSLMVLPFDIIAKKIPVTGAYAIHTAQSYRVHDLVSAAPPMSIGSSQNLKKLSNHSAIPAVEFLAINNFGPIIINSINSP